MFSSHSLHRSRAIERREIDGIENSEQVVGPYLATFTESVVNDDAISLGSHLDVTGGISLDLLRQHPMAFG